MHKFVSAVPVTARVQVMLTQRREAYAYLAALVAEHRAKTFKDPETATAVIAAMGQNAAAAIAWDESTTGYLNAVGPRLGRPEVPDAIPAGYAFTPNEDGTGTVTYTAPAPVDSPALP